MTEKKPSHNQRPNPNQYQNQAQPTQQQYMPQPIPPQYQQPTDQNYYAPPTQSYNPPPPPVQPNQGYYPRGYRPPPPPKKWYQNGWVIVGLVVLALFVIGSAAKAGKTTTTASATATAAPVAAPTSRSQPTQAVAESNQVQPTKAAQAASQTQATTKAAPAPTATKAAPAPTATKAAPVLPGLNQAVTLGEVKLTITGVASAGNSIQYTTYGNKLQAAGVWIKVDLIIGNVSNKTKSLGTWDFKLKDAQGRIYDASSDSFTFAIFQNLKSPSDPIPPGSSISTVLLFDTTAGATGLQLEAAPDFKKQLFQLS